MQQNSANLSLPYIQPAQAQKHVTHNEAIRLLDALVQAVVQEPPRNTAPGTAPEGARYLVGEAPAGDWADHPGQIAWRTDGAWSFLEPQPGWSVRILSDGTVRAWLNGAWRADAAGSAEVLTQLGVNTGADQTNRLAVSGDATLLTHDGAGHQVKVNKAAPGDTASLLFQTGFSGRAEMGTAGDDGFSVKVSDDGSDWKTGLVLDPVTGLAAFPSGAMTARRIEIGGRWQCLQDRWVGFTSNYGASTYEYTQNCGTGAEPGEAWTHLGPFLPQGAQLTGVTGALRRTDPEITGIDIRVAFQTGDWAADWDSGGETTRTTLFAQNGMTLGNGWTRIDAALGGAVTPQDGYLLVFIRPLGTLSATRHLLSSLSVGYLSAR